MRFQFCVMTLCFFLVSCAAPGVRPAAQSGDASDWVQSELFFGIAEATAEPQRVAELEHRWQVFLDTEVTPRFPDGLSVYDVYGQWRSPKRNAITHARSKSLLIVYHDSPQHRADIEAVRDAWKKLTGDESVLRVTQHVDVSF